MLWGCCSGDGDGRVCGPGNGATLGVCDFKGDDGGRKEDGECVGAIVGTLVLELVMVDGFVMILVLEQP